MSNYWSPIIYGSTYEVDFRLIVKPEDFEQKQIKWAKKYILETIQIKEGKDWATNLRDSPRWSLFRFDPKKNEPICCIIGVTGMADMFSDSMNQDYCGRPLYAFVGCVARLSSTAEAPLPPLTIDFFKSIYEKYVEKRWEEKQFQAEKADERAKAKYQEYPIGKYDFELSELPDLNTERGKIRLFPQPSTEEERNKFLLAAFRHEKPTSICLGLPEQKYVSEKVFLNAGLINIQEIKNIISEKKKSTSEATQKELISSSTKAVNEKMELERLQEKISIYESKIKENTANKVNTVKQERKVKQQIFSHEPKGKQDLLPKFWGFTSYLLDMVMNSFKKQVDENNLDLNKEEENSFSANKKYTEDNYNEWIDSDKQIKKLGQDNPASGRNKDSSQKKPKTNNLSKKSFASFLESTELDKNEEINQDKKK